MRWRYGCLALACVAALGVTSPASARVSRYCEKPDGPGAFLAASSGVRCATAEIVKSKLTSPSCYRHNRCVVAGFRCITYWNGRFDLSFEGASHALCTSGSRWIVWDGG